LFQKRSDLKQWVLERRAKNLRRVGNPTRPSLTEVTGQDYWSFMELTATEFKAKCLSLIDQVHAGGEPVVITKHGQVVAKLVGASTSGPITETREKLSGSVKSYVDPFESAVSSEDVVAYA
jgi:prevent-host-death family protein